MESEEVSEDMTVSMHEKTNKSVDLRHKKIVRK